MRVRIDQVIERQPQVSRRDIGVPNVRPQGGVSESNFEFNTLVVNSELESLSASDGALVVRGGAGIMGDLNVADEASIGTDLLVNGSAEVTSGFQSTGNAVFLADVEHTGSNVGFFGTTPAAQPAPIADATGAGDVVAQLNALLAALRTLGIIDT